MKNEKRKDQRLVRVIHINHNAWALSELSKGQPWFVSLPSHNFGPDKVVYVGIQPRVLGLSIVFAIVAEQ